jgi:ATP-binding cassette, subfamily C (CFTR/MRP), member 4
MDSFLRIEMKLVGKTSYIRGFSLALMVFTERSALYATIVIFVLSGSTLRGDIVFSMSQYYNLLQLTVSIMFPYALSTFGEARISVKRLQVC